MTDYSFVSGAVQRVRERVMAAAARAGRDPAGVAMLAVTKFHPIEAVSAAWEAGIGLFGESRVQEAERKYPVFLAAHPSARLDMIGHIQSNKAGKAVALFSRLESVDSTELLLELDRRARAADIRREVLLELHTGEESKEGFRGAEELYRALELILAHGDRRIEPRGLMTMAPRIAPAMPRDAGDEARVRASFRSLRAALEGARSRFSLKGFDVLSMGMTGDFEIAVEEGSTLVRIGTALFGGAP
jgi:pyridoxal phosphate enzyme (YggS family)